MKEYPHRLSDPYGRRLNYLRVSVTDRCNLRCIYCRPLGGISKLNHDDILTYEEILRITGIAARLGVRKVRVTGGEPLVRKGLCDFISRLWTLSGIREVTLTTNGILLEKNLENLKAAGIERLNISLDSLQKSRFRDITGYDGFDRVMGGIRAADEAGFRPIKINMVVLKGMNDDELADFAAMTMDHPYHVRFIEYMPIRGLGTGGVLNHIPSEQIKERLGHLGRLFPLPRHQCDGPSERFRLAGARGEIGFISPLTHHFCDQCNRLRLTSRGTLRPCLLSNVERDLREPIRSGADDAELAGLIVKAVEDKPGRHNMGRRTVSPLRAHMSAIGG